MCGIVGIIAEAPFTSKELLGRLKRLEYRGYDSYGYWNGATLDRHTGRILVADDGEETRCAISHTRWATHGGVTEANAHPHRVGHVTLVHNGIIENWRELQEAVGAQRSSETDSEIVVHYLAARIKEGATPEEALDEFVRVARGTFALLVMVDGDERLYAAKRDSPLALGIGERRILIASDIYAFSDETTKAVFLENEDVVTVAAASYTVRNSGRTIERQATHVRWEASEGRGGHEHYMLKEIHETPLVAASLLDSLEGEQEKPFQRLVEAVRRTSKVVFVAAGTAYHASLLGASLLHACGVNAQAIIASEFETFVTLDENSLVVAVSQSGETMDVIEALKHARGATLASIVNVPHSSIERACHHALRTNAGQEVAVASTKAFTNQVLVMLALARAFGYENSLKQLPEKLRAILQLEHDVQRLAFELHRHAHLYIIGRRLGYPVAREFALKVKEVSYVHAEGMMAGELKHGTIALIEAGTPVVCLVYGEDTRMQSSTTEVAARGARTITVGTSPGADLTLPAESEAEFMLLAAVVGQLLAYHIARERGLPIDKPRNLAKSVTVL